MNFIQRHFDQIGEALTLVDEDQVRRTIEIMKTVRAAGGNVWLAGNGGSAATASHFANDLTKMGRVKSISLSDLTPLTLAHGNDDGWDAMFSYPLESLIGPKDAVIGISCSGNSMNVVNFLIAARGKYKIAFTGPDQDSKISKSKPDVVIRAMANDITVQEDVHSIVCHAIARSLRDAGA